MKTIRAEIIWQINGKNAQCIREKRATIPETSLNVDSWAALDPQKSRSQVSSQAALHLKKLYVSYGVHETLDENKNELPISLLSQETPDKKRTWTT